MGIRNLIVIFCILTFTLLLSSLYGEKNKVTIHSFHTDNEKVMLHEDLRAPIDSDQYFLSSSHCKGCHGFDSAGIANVDGNGIDINLFDDWETTMMANSARDPLWRAKVSHEILVDPQHSLDIQNKCTSCHAPMGHYTSFFKAKSHYTLNDLANDTLGIDGVSCTGCHMIAQQDLGKLFSGNIPYDTTRKLYGPFSNPFAGPMQLYEGFTPTHSAHISESRFCSPCHTLIVDTKDLSGNPTGKIFVEQATYHEWLNSAFSADLITCQNCHMPRAEDSVIIANGFLNLQPRFPYNQHKFMGGNEFMIKLMKKNKNALGIKALDKHFDSTLSVTKYNLQHNTLDLQIMIDSMNSDTAYIRVKLTNKAGHKFPSGYPSRRAVLQFIVIGESKDTIFQSGIFDANFEVKKSNPGFEPHHNIISNENQTQIYEMVMGDLNQQVTTILGKTDTILKDNRLTPEGFVTTHYTYDTVFIAGDALHDPDFNKFQNGTEGSGTDFVHYHVPVKNKHGMIKVIANMYYQSVPPGSVAEMFTHNSTEINTFKNMFQDADHTPVLVNSDTITSLLTGIEYQKQENLFSVYPNPTADGIVKIISLQKDKVIDRINVYSIEGELISSTQNLNNTETLIQLPSAKGNYIIEIYIDKMKWTQVITRF